jgi:hypothetical protein
MLGGLNHSNPQAWLALSPGASACVSERLRQRSQAAGLTSPLQPVATSFYVPERGLGQRSLRICILSEARCQAPLRTDQTLDVPSRLHVRRASVRPVDAVQHG